MIKAGLVAMAVIGCDCDARMCEYIRTTDAHWSSVADCEADMRANVLIQHESYPLVVAVCRDTAEGAGAIAGTELDAVMSSASNNGRSGPAPTAREPAAPPAGGRASDDGRPATWRQSAVAAASSIVSPLLAGAPAGTSSTDDAGRVTTVFRSEHGLVSIRDTVGGALSSASRRALGTVGWLRAAVTPDWF